MFWQKIPINTLAQDSAAESAILLFFPFLSQGLNYFGLF
jgi:hypothetical protein